MDSYEGGGGGGGVNRQFQWITTNGHPVLYSTTGMVEQNNGLRSGYERMQFTGLPEGAAAAAYAHYIQQGQVPVTRSNVDYMTAAMPVNSVNYTGTVNTGGSVAGELTYAELGVIGATEFIGGGMTGKKMQYTTATLGRPPRHPDVKRQEPTIYAQVSGDTFFLQLFYCCLILSFVFFKCPAD